MRYSLSLFLSIFFFSLSLAQPKRVKTGLNSVASVIVYSNGTVKADGTAFFVDSNSDLLASSSLFYGADSAVVIDSKGKSHAVEYIVGINEMFDCVKLRVSPVKKIKPLLHATSKVGVGDELYMLAYGVKGKGMAEPVKVLAVDSVYSLAYYTLDIPMKDNYLSRPLLNADGELVAVMQPTSLGDTVNSYAVSATLSSSLSSSVKSYGKGYYPGMGIRTAMPQVQEEALSCMYMQAMMGDSASWRNAIDDYIASYPKSYEGYQSLAEYISIYYRDMERANDAWDRALSLTDNKAELFFGKGKVINSIVQSGDTVSHSTLSFDNALQQIDKALSLDRQQLYLNYKADMLYTKSRYADAVECYEELVTKDMNNPEVFAKLSQCHVMLGNSEKAVVMLDSAIACFDDKDGDVAPYLLARAVVKVSINRHREAVLDMNRYEELAGGVLDADFYYMREQAELKAKMYQQALNDIETAIGFAPDNILYYIEKGMLCYRVKLFDEGIRTMEQASHIAPETADIFYLLGCLHVQKGDKNKAIESFEKAHSLGHTGAGIQLEKLK